MTEPSVQISNADMVSIFSVASATGGGWTSSDTAMLPQCPFSYEIIQRLEIESFENITFIQFQLTSSN